MKKQTEDDKLRDEVRRFLANLTSAMKEQSERIAALEAESLRQAGGVDQTWSGSVSGCSGHLGYGFRAIAVDRQY